MKVRDNIAFMVFVVSASAMDSKSIFIPSICCICSLIYLKRRAMEYEYKWKCDNSTNGKI